MPLPIIWIVVGIAACPGVKSLSAQSLSAQSLSAQSPSAQSRSDPSRSDQRSTLAYPAINTYQGFTEPSEDILISTSEIGRITAIDVRMGQAVRRGQVVLSLDQERQQAAVELSRLQAEMRGEIELAEAERVLHQRRTEKLIQLVDAGAARREELLRSQSALATSKARLRMAAEQQTLRRQQYERDRLLLKRRSILAPTNGVIADVLRDVGESVTPADSALIRMVVLDPLMAGLNIPAREAAGLKVGQELPLFLVSAQATVVGVVREISPTIDDESGTIRVRLEIANPNGSLQAGDQCTLEERLGSPAIQGPRTPNISLLRPSLNWRANLNWRPSLTWQPGSTALEESYPGSVQPKSVPRIAARRPIRLESETQPNPEIMLLRPRAIRLDEPTDSNPIDAGEAITDE
ncbi:MAG: efflux RND transporter periplasmic adaptor subunit [Planctomycetota bacterium]